MKRYFVTYESDEVTCRQNVHTYGYGNTLKTCKQYFKRIRERYKADNPRNLKIYDSAAEIDPETGFVPVVYWEA